MDVLGAFAATAVVIGESFSVFAAPWLLIACLIYGWFARSKIRSDTSLTRLAVCSALAAALLGPGVLVGGHFVLAVPPGPAIALATFAGNGASEMAMLNWASLAISAASFLGLSSWLRRRARRAVEPR
jgi:hypothetical protein